MIVAEFKLHLRGVRSPVPSGTGRSTPRMVKRILPITVACTLLAVFLVIQLSSALKESKTYDEPLFVEAGYKFLTERDFTFDPFNPPLARELIALPLLFNHNLINDPFFFWPRVVVILFSVGLGLLVFFWSKKRYGPWGGVFSLLVLVFTPEFLAYSHYANTDLISTFFIFLSLMLFFNKKWLLFFFSFGLAMASRVTAIFFVAIPLFFYWILFLRKEQKINFPRIVLGEVLALLVIWSTYFFTWEPAFGYRKDPNRQAISFIKEHPNLSFLLDKPIPFGSFISTIKNNYLYNQTDKFPKYAFWNGKVMNSGPGYLIWPIFLIKTPIPLIIFLTYLFFQKDKNEEERYLKFIILFIFLEAVFLGSNLRLRYFLIIYPLLAVLSGRIFTDFIKGKIWQKLIVVGGVLWLVIGTLNVYPHFLTYFNEFIGGSDNGYKYLVDSNLDWGQGLPTLKKYLDEKGIKNVQLTYFGSNDPKDFGISYTRVKDFGGGRMQELVELNPKKPLVISVSCWYFCGYYLNPELVKLKPKILSGLFLLFNF